MNTMSKLALAAALGYAGLVTPAAQAWTGDDGCPTVGGCGGGNGPLLTGIAQPSLNIHQPVVTIVSMPEGDWSDDEDGAKPQPDPDPKRGSSGGGIEVASGGSGGGDKPGSGGTDPK